MICQQCEAEISDNCNFCTQCGAEIQRAGDVVQRSPRTNYRLDLGKLLSDTFELYKRHFGTMCLVGLLLFGVPMIFYVGSQLSNVMMQTVAPRGGRDTIVFTFLLMGIFFSMMLLQNLAQWYFILGAIRQSLYLARGGIGFQTHQMFPPFMMFLKMVGIMLLIMCITLPMILPAGITYGVAMFTLGVHNDMFLPLFTAAIVLFIAAICGMTWVQIRLFLAQMFIADRDAGVIDSMKDAWRISSGNFWMLLLACFVLWIFAMLGFFLCCVGIIMTIAITSLGSVLAYLQLTGQPNCLDYPPPQDLEEQR